MSAAVGMGNLLKVEILSSVIVVAFSFALTPAARSACTVDITGTIQTCTGNLSTGVFAGPTITTLNINSLTADIAPASGTPGISNAFLNFNGLTINSQTAPFQVLTTGDNAPGMNATTFGSLPLTVSSTGNFVTHGNNSGGIVASATGEPSASITLTSVGNVSTSGVLSDGISAISNTGGNANVTSSGNISTKGDFSRGIIAAGTSIGSVKSTGNIFTAGNMSNGIAAGGSDFSFVTSTGDITTIGNNSHGIAAQTVTSSGNISTAGDGSEGIRSIAFNVGLATATSNGNISTLGSGAIGIHAASDLFATVNSAGNITTAGDGAIGIFVNSQLGSATKSPPTVTSVGNIATAGGSAHGIFAQSDISGFSFGPGDKSNFGALTLVSIGNISTVGQNSNGIYANSIGSFDPGFGPVSVQSTGDISTRGNNSHGIFANSGPGSVLISSIGNVVALGANSDGIRGSSAGGNISITTSGTVIGGFGTGVGVNFIGGANNTLINSGTITTVNGLVGTAVLGNTGNNSISNSGIIIGNVDLGTGANAFNNQSGGIFISGATVNLGANNTLSNHGTLSPGGIGVIQTTALTGNLTFSPGSYYLIDVSPTASDRINITGNAALAGTVQATFQPGNYLMRSYTILSAAGGRSSTFDSLSTANLPAGFTASLSYTATDAILNLAATLSPSGPAAPVPPPSQINVANALNNFFNNGGTLPPNFLALFNLTGGNLANALTLLSGEPATGAQQGAFQLMNEFMGVMLDPFVDGRAGIAGANGQANAFAPDREPLPEDIALAYAKVLRTPVYKASLFEPRWSVWAAGYGGYNQTTGDPLVAGSHDLSTHTAGGAAGMDYRIAPGTVIGFALAGGGTGWSLAQGLGSGRSDAFQAGVYGTARYGPAYLGAALAYTEYWMSTDRYAFAGDYLTANLNAQNFGGRVETGHRVPVGLWGLTPYAAVQAQNFHTPTYSETDVSGGGFGLTYDARNATDTRSELGARFDRQILLNWSAVLALRGRVGWAHDWISDPSLVPVFQALPGASFIVNGATPAKNSTLTSAGAELRLINGVLLLAKFDGEFAAHSQTYAGTGTVRYTW
jgi:uncharacterized protein with beta-barrel porin domain